MLPLTPRANREQFSALFQIESRLTSLRDRSNPSTEEMTEAADLVSQRGKCDDPVSLKLVAPMETPFASSSSPDSASPSAPLHLTQQAIARLFARPTRTNQSRPPQRASQMRAHPDRSGPDRSRPAERRNPSPRQSGSPRLSRKTPCPSRAPARTPPRLDPHPQTRRLPRILARRNRCCMGHRRPHHRLKARFQSRINRLAKATTECKTRAASLSVHSDSTTIVIGGQWPPTPYTRRSVELPQRAVNC